MEFNEQHPFLEELLALRKEPWENTIPTGMNDELFSSGWSSFDAFNDNTDVMLPNVSLEGFSMPFEQDFNINPFNDVQYYPIADEFSPSQVTENSPNMSAMDATSFPLQEDLPLFSVMEHGEVPLAGLMADDMQSLQMQVTCKMEPNQSPELPAFSASGGTCVEPRNTRAKKLNGQPSKNLMAERRRRKRLNDRLSMLRSIVPKISKMDRTSILGDTIDYVKELLEKISNLQQEIEELGSDRTSTMISAVNDTKPNDLYVRNSPKFSVERRNEDTRIEICCAGKPGLLLSTVNTLEALGLEIEQCVISCFNDFAMQASCSEVIEQRTLRGAEDIKQALFENAGYGGKCV